MLPAGFKPAIPASGWLQTHILDYMNTAIAENSLGSNIINSYLITKSVLLQYYE